MFEPRLGQRQYNKDPTIKARLTYKFTSVPGLVAASCCTFLDLDQLDNNELNVWFHFGIHIQQAPSPNQLALSVVLRRLLKDILSSEDKDILDVTLGGFMHFSVKTAQTGLMSHYP